MLYCTCTVEYCTCYYAQNRNACGMQVSPRTFACLSSPTDPKPYAWLWGGSSLRVTHLVEADVVYDEHLAQSIGRAFASGADLVTNYGYTQSWRYFHPECASQCLSEQSSTCNCCSLKCSKSAIQYITRTKKVIDESLKNILRN